MILILALFSGLMGARTAGLALIGARIHTVTPQIPIVSDIAVKDGRVLATGDNVQFHMGVSTRRTDGKGFTIIPALKDCHGRPGSLGDSLELLDFRGAEPVEEVAEMVRRAAPGRKPGEWIRGWSWNDLMRVDGPAAWVNRKALEIADIISSTPAPPGGRIPGVTVRSINLMAAGALGSCGAALLVPCSDDPGDGGLPIVQKPVEHVVREAAAQGFQVNTHATGHRANRTVLEVYGAASEPKTYSG